MADGPMTNDEVAQVVWEAGVGQAVHTEISYDMIADPKLREVWRRAENALEEIEAILEEEE